MAIVLMMLGGLTGTAASVASLVFYDASFGVAITTYFGSAIATMALVGLSVILRNTASDDEPVAQPAPR